MDNNQPVFIVGVKRSGTTLLRLLLDSHSQLAITPESQFIGYFYNNISNYGELSVSSNLLNLLKDISRCKRFKFRGTQIASLSALVASLNNPNPTFSDIIQTLNSKYMADHGKNKWGDKTPIFHKYVDMLISLFPKCKIICLIRDPRSSILSQMVKYHESNVYKLSEEWKEGMETYEKSIEKLPGEQHLELFYEDLVSNPGIELMKVCKFLQLPYEEKMLRYHETHADDMHTCTSDLYLQKISNERTERWKEILSKKDVLRIEETLGDSLERYGYQCFINDFSGQITLPRTIFFDLKCLFKKYSHFYNVKLFILSILFKFFSRTPIRHIRRYSWYFDKSCNWTSSNN